MRHGRQPNYLPARGRGLSLDRLRVLQKYRVGVPFKMLRERIPMLSAMTLDQLGAKMRCDKCGKRPERHYPANQSDTPGFVRRI
jgi:hypothetical protein